MFREGFYKIAPLLPGCRQPVRLDQALLPTAIPPASGEQSFEYRQTGMFSLKLAHHLELATQTVFGRKHPQHPVKKTVDRPQRQPVHLLHQIPQCRLEIIRPEIALRLADATGQALGFLRVTRCPGQLGEDPLKEFPGRLAGERQRDDPLRRLAIEQQPNEAVGELEGFP